MEWILSKNDPKLAEVFFERKMRFTLGPVELQHYREKGAPMNIVDVRRAEDYAKGHIPGAVSLPEEKWETLQGLSKDKPNILYCYSIVCHLAAKAAVNFASRGYPVYELDGGFASWKEHGLPIKEALAAQR